MQRKDVEHVKIINSSYGKKKILMGTSKGTMIVLSVEDFKIEQIITQDQKGVVFLSDNRNIIVSSHEDFKVIIYKKNDYKPHQIE